MDKRTWDPHPCSMLSPKTPFFSAFLLWRRKLTVRQIHYMVSCTFRACRLKSMWDIVNKLKILFKNQRLWNLISIRNLCLMTKPSHRLKVATKTVPVVETVISSSLHMSELPKMRELIHLYCSFVGILHSIS